MGLRITPDERHATEARIALINKRAQKRGFTGKVELHAEQVIKTERNAGGVEIETVWFDCEITGEAPCYGGYRFLAALDNDPAAGIITRPAPGFTGTIDRDTLHADWCDHCKMHRNRRTTYLVEHTDTGHRVQVGSTCIKDFLGWDARFVFLAADDVMAKVGDGGFGGTPMYSTDTVLAVSIAVIDVRGFVRSSEMHSTRQIVHSIIDPINKNERAYAHSFASKVQAAMPQARALRAWLDSDAFTGDSEYVHNLKRVARADMVTPRNFGLIVSAPQAKAKADERTLIRQARKAAAADMRHIGTLGEKITVTGMVTRVDTITGDYGSKKLITITTDDGNVIKSFTNTARAWELEQGEHVTVTGKVKKHDEWRGELQTLINYPKFSS